MGLLKDLGNIAGIVTGSVIGGTVKFVGEVTNSKFIEDVGDGVKRATIRTGDFLGTMAEGTVDTVVGIATSDEQKRKQGTGAIKETVADTSACIGNGITKTFINGVLTIDAIACGDTEKAKELGKDLLKIASISALSIGAFEAVDGFEADAPDQIADNTSDGLNYNIDPRLESVDFNGDGQVTIAEAKVAGFETPITEDHWLYQHMDDGDNDGMVGEYS